MMWYDSPAQPHPLLVLHPFYTAMPSRQTDPVEHTIRYCGKMSSHRLTQGRCIHLSTYSIRHVTICSSFCVLCLNHLHINPERISTKTWSQRDKQQINSTQKPLIDWRCFQFPACLKTEYSSGPCNPLTVIRFYQHSIKPTDTFKQSALFIKGCFCAKRGRRRTSAIHSAGFSLLPFKQVHISNRRNESHHMKSCNTAY